MDNNFDKNKVIELLFDTEISAVLSELEDGGKELSYLSTKSGLNENDIKHRLSYLIEYGFIIEQTVDTKTVFSANAEKLSKLMESNDNFEGVTDGLTKLDSYLN